MKNNFFINSCKALYSWYTGDLNCSHLPVYVMVEPTNYCNLRCPICKNPATKREKGIMDYNLFQEIIARNKNFFYKIYLHYFGESLLAPNLCQMIRYAMDSGIPCILETNGLLLTDDLSRYLIQAGLREISFSFDGLNKEYYENIRRGALYEETLEKIIRFLETKKRLGNDTPLVYLQIININFTQKQIVACRDKFKKFGFNRIDIIPLHKWKGILLPQAETDRLGQGNKKFYCCFMPWVLLSILWDGRVTPCCDDCDGDYIIGDASRDSLIDIWKGTSIRALRSKIVHKKNTDFLPCSNCFRPRESPLKFPMFEYAKREIAGFLKNRLFNHPGM